MKKKTRRAVIKYRSAVNGQYVTKKYAARHERNTVKETDKGVNKRKKGKQ